MRPGPDLCRGWWVCQYPVLYHPHTTVFSHWHRPRHTLSPSPPPQGLGPLSYLNLLFLGSHRPRPLPPGLSWWKLCVRFPSQECVHCGSWDRLYSRRHVYTCNLSWKIVWIIPGTTQMWVFSSNDQIDWNYANGTHVRDHCHRFPWQQIVHESWIKDLLPGCDCLSFQTRGDSPLWSGQWQFSKLALYCHKLGCTKCRAVAGAKLMLQLIPDHRIDRSNKKMLCFPAQKQITLPPPFVKSSWTANELLHSSRICTISV